MIRRPPRSTQGVSSAASDVYKRQDQMSQIGPGNLWTEGASEAFRRELAKEQATLQHQQNVETRAKMHSAVNGNFVTAPSQLSSQLPPVASANPRDISGAPAASPASPRDPDVCVPQTYPPVPPPAPESHKPRALAAPGGMVTDGGFRKSEDNGRRWGCLLYTSPSPRDQRGSRMPSSA